ncbi:MAG: hypothetical protein JW892_07050, partial [Anaerolineae bacterium]|nr:hypothetical protein [Anaerolineae bacterium]
PIGIALVQKLCFCADLALFATICTKLTLGKSVFGSGAGRRFQKHRKDPLCLFAQPLPIFPKNLSYTPNCLPD